MTNRAWIVIKQPAGPEPETVTASQLRADVYELIDTCKSWPIVITRRGTAEAVLISMKDFLEHYTRTPTRTLPSE